MKFSFLVLFMLTLLSCDLPDKKNNGWDKYKLSGEVKSFRELSYSVISKFGETQKDQRKTELEIRGGYKSPDDKFVIFNRSGNILEDSRLYSNDEVAYKEIYNYESHAGVIEKSKYDSQGNLTEKTFLNKDGNVIEVQSFRDSKTYNRKVTYSYNKTNQKVEEVVYSPTGQLNKTTYRYDNQGNQFESKDGIDKDIPNLRYDDKGNVAELFIAQPNKSFYRLTYLYDNKQNLLENTYYSPSGEINRKFVYKYNNNNDKIGHILFNSLGAIDPDINFKYDYVYDKQHNWIKCIIYKTEMPFCIIERTIDYY
jgi:YD repeat-containing protein